jgi:hypothetical protein
LPKKRVSSSTAASAGKLPYISASMRSTFKRCRYQWHFRYMRRLEPKIAAPPLRFGTLLHTALEHRYRPGVKRGPHPARIFEKAYEKEFGSALALGFRDDDGKWHDALSLGVDMLEHYIDHYGADSEWRVLASEQTFEQPVYAPGTRERIGTYIAVLDLIMENRSNGNIMIWDHKGVKSIDTSYLAMDDQSSGYWAFGVDWLRERGVLKPGKELQGILFNFLRKGKRDDRAKNEDGHFTNKPKKEHYVAALQGHGLTNEVLERMKVADLEAMAAKRRLIVLGDVSEKQPAPHFNRFISWRGEHERQLTKDRVAHEMAEMGLVKAGKLAMLKTPDKTHCKFCDVRDICELHETGSDWEEMMRLIMVPRRPIRREAIEYEHDH